jgi:hypothetical protein
MEVKEILSTKGAVAMDAAKGRAVDTACCALVIGLSKKALPKGQAAELDKGNVEIFRKLYAPDSYAKLVDSSMGQHKWAPLLEIGGVEPLRRTSMMLMEISRASTEVLTTTDLIWVRSPSL